ncbi:hypothetical protein SteCoe_5161 [Stentor coeruleus]|uniref:Uncharacterized protein n=1 Tax=Stentor coeruleus TaxID=5963 RepID=A0A1R2CT51_9CILI|nr:hypothetical protein SteCoe_5161 [Stentor coeruleus]
MSLHQSKLKLIQKRKSILTCSTPTPNFRSNRKFIYKEKKQEITKENRAIFDKLLTIAKSTISTFSSSPYDRVIPNFRSSSEISRKNKEQKIAFENQILVKKLIDIKPFLIKKNLDEDYSEYKKRKKRLTKLNIPSPVKVSESFKPIIQVVNDDDLL